MNNKNYHHDNGNLVHLLSIGLRVCVFGIAGDANSYFGSGYRG